MKRLATFVTLLPATAFAHGAHPPVAPEAHGVAHALPVLVALAITVGLGLELYARWRQ